MPRKKHNKAEMRTIIFIDAVNYTQELKEFGRDAITPKINQLKEFAEFFFVYKLKGEFIGKLGDGFLILCPPTPVEIISEAVSCQSFIAAYNYEKNSPEKLNVRIAIHFGIIAPPEEGNYIDTNLNLTARLEGATPANCICISSVLHQIVSDVLRGYKFEEMEAEFKGLGHNKYYLVTNPLQSTELTKRELRLGFYFSTIQAFRSANKYENASETCKQALTDFPDNPEILFQLASSYKSLKEFDQALLVYEQCVKLNYEKGMMLYFMGNIYITLDNYELAMDKFNESIKAEPKFFHSMAGISEIYLAKKDYVQSKKWAKKALNFAPKYLTPISIMVILELLNGNEEGAKEWIGKVEFSRHLLLKRFLQNQTRIINDKNLTKKAILLLNSGT